ncbi:PhzF family phenazine biosynthesis protein [Pseudomonas denitrificans (nom. rej.)]|nr:PhzF family phenazine biosynthesis protein [Pseudomonas denitrificans (nom. rej.)]
MPLSLQFEQVDVFAEQRHEGNALAVVVGADELSTEQMQAFARWTQLSETTFLLKPRTPEAHYRVRIFTPLRELPFAGHPTLGSCKVWLDQQDNPELAEIIQECPAGLIRVRRRGPQLAFSAPPLLRSGPLDALTLNRIEQGLGLTAAQIRASEWVDNGPGWAGVLLASRDEVLGIRPDYAALQGLNVGVIAPWVGPAAEADVEVRAFMGEECNEDPVTGSLNAGLAQWLIGTGTFSDRYSVSQGTALGRRGRLQIESTGKTLWVGGAVQRCISGRVLF